MKELPTHVSREWTTFTPRYPLKDTQIKQSFQDHTSDINAYCKNQDTSIKGLDLVGGT